MRIGRLYAQFVCLDNLRHSGLVLVDADAAPLDLAAPVDRSENNPFALPAGRTYWPALTKYWTTWRRQQCRRSTPAMEVQARTAGDPGRAVQLAVDLSRNGRKDKRAACSAGLVPLVPPRLRWPTVWCCGPPHALRAASDAALTLLMDRLRSELKKIDMLPVRRVW